MTKVLTFSTNISAGHKRAAEAIASAVLAECPNAEIVERDAMMVMGPRRRRLLTDTYLGIIRYRPDLWDYLYQNKNISSGITRLSRIFSARVYEAFEAEIESHAPDVVICTQAIPARILGDLKVRGRCPAPLLAVATDYGIHPYWAHPAIDGYAVPCAEAEEELVVDGIDRSRIHVTGIPVDQLFEDPPAREISRHMLGLPTHGRFVLVMGGGNGLGVTASHIEAIENTRGVDGVIVVTGCNSALEREISKLPQTADKIRLVLPTVTDIERYYAAADLLVSKPGGLTMSEATAMGMPIIMISPLPGQEMRNAHFLSRTGAAHLANSSEELSLILADLITHEGRLGESAAASLRVGRSAASRQIASLALNMTTIAAF